MQSDRFCRRSLWILAGLLVVAAVERLYHINAPLLDQLYTKQVYVANKARNMARTPWNPMRQELDFLDSTGSRTVLIEEFPLFTGALSAGYALFGEREWIGRVLSIVAALVAIGALADLVRGEWRSSSRGLYAALLAAASPLLVFWGRCVLPDVAMLASMLVACAAHRRWLDGGRNRMWWIAAVAGCLAGLFKPYGLMVLVALADQALRREGLRGLWQRRFLLLSAIIALPIVSFMAGVFALAPNPTNRTTYLVIHQPEVLLWPRFWEALFWRFPVKDLGPVGFLAAIIGVFASIRGRGPMRPILAWLVIGLGFFVGFAPKLVDHDYYELPLLPAGVMVGALGLERLLQVLAARGLVLGRGAQLVAASLVLLIQSPLVFRDKFELEPGHRIAAERLRALSATGERAVILGHPQPWAIMHYSTVPCWSIPGYPVGWERELSEFRSLGARHVMVYADPLVPDRDRAKGAALARELVLLDRGRGPWFRRGRLVEYEVYASERDRDVPAAITHDLERLDRR